MKAGITTAVVLVSVVFALPSSAPADWDPGDSYISHHPQNPDPNGWDIIDYSIIDDFEVTQDGPFTDIHFWVSYHGDVYFDVYEWEVHIIKDDPSGPWGHQPSYWILWSLWEAQDNYDVSIREYGQGNQGWHEPSTPLTEPNDHTKYYQVNITNIANPNNFQLVAGQRYWLTIGPEYTAPQPLHAGVGWKTSLDSFGSPAFWCGPTHSDWGDWQVVNPGTNVHMAFVTTGPEVEPDDWGDAPDPNYPTTSASNGARHTIVPAFHLGARIDGESDGQPDSNALGDDTDGHDDEDGVAFLTPLRPGKVASVRVTASVAGRLDGWIDYNGDGSWAQGGDQVFNDSALAGGVNIFSIAVPATASPDITTFARFRFSSAGALPYTGSAFDGEVEDYKVSMGAESAPGDDCTNPKPITVSSQNLPVTDSDTTCGRGDDYQNTCLGGYDAGEDIIYELDVAAAFDVQVMLDPKGTPFTGIAIDTVCPPGDPCLAYSTNTAASPHGFCVHLEPGTYYIMIDTFTDMWCIPEFDLSIALGSPPVNDDCANAIQFSVDVTNLPYDTTCATIDGSGTCMTGPNIWYCYQASCTGEVHVSLCGSESDTKLAVYDGCTCNPLGAELDCNDDSDCNGDGTNELQSQVWFNAVAGNQYLIEIGGYSDHAGRGLLTIECRSAKWSQRPHKEGEGHGEASNLWLRENKWEQAPEPDLGGYHAHDYWDGLNVATIIMADDWLCAGGKVTDLHWWGHVELGREGAGIAGFHVSIHDNNPVPVPCLPQDPAA
ncbi:MAG: hypothetical protein GY778_31250 [bacterium]|nr:hypothetical protein [bacterium]